MARYEFSEGTSNKFWEIDIDGTTVTTTYGRIGSDGRSTVKEFGSEEEAQKFYDKQVASKLKKGYQAVGGKKATKKKKAVKKKAVKKKAVKKKAKKKKAKKKAAKKKSSGGMFDGKTVVVTGTFRVKRSEVKKILKGLGARVTGSVSSKTDILIVGEDPGSKVEDAEANDVQILQENDVANELYGEGSEAPPPNPKPTFKPSDEVGVTSFDGKKVVITGTLSTMDRREAQAALEDAGADVTGSVSGKTEILICGTDAGSKLTKAQKLGIPILSEEQFLAILNGEAGDAGSNGASADDSPAGRLRALLGPLCSTAEDREILEQLCAEVTGFDEGEVQFNDGSFNFEEGGSFPRNPSVPASFSEIGNVVAALTWDGGGPEVGFALSSDGSSLADGWLFSELDGDEVSEVAEAGGPGDAFIGGQNGLFFDPTRKLANGEQALAFISHEEVEWTPVTSADALNYKQIFLRMIADAMVGTDFINEIYF